MSDENENKEQRIGLWLAGGAAALATAAVVLFSTWGWETGRIDGAQAPEAAAVVIDGNSAQVIVDDNGVVKFYFATGKSDVADGAQAALHDVLEGIKEGKKAIVSGYHDSTGNQAQNEALSKQRALAVRDALIVFGVPEDQIELRKPADSEGTGSNAEARRVEVVLE